MIIDLVQLRTFVAVAEEHHLTRAAERLHISQSAASAHVRAVEESLDTPLFIRTNRTLELTKTGQAVLEQAKILLNGAAHFTTFTRELRGKLDGELIVGASTEPTGSRMGEVIAAMRKDHPMITVDLRSRPSAGTRQSLKTGEIDVGVLLCRPVDAGFTYYLLENIPYRIAGPVAWKAEIEAADWAKLASLPWLTPNASSFAHATMLAQLFGDRGLELNTVVRFDSLPQGRSLLKCGVGVMLMREELALEGVRDGHLALSPLGQAEFGLFVAHVTSRGTDPLIRAFIEATKTVWPKISLSSES
jgi:DNA-binding transcriptional LysR family regulator